MEIRPLDLLILPFQRPLPVLLLILLGMAAAFGVTRWIYPLQYEATVSLYVAVEESEVTEPSAADLAEDYAALFVNRSALDAVAEALDLPVDAAKLKERIRVSHPTGTRVLRVAVRDSDPQRAAEIANQFAAISGEMLSQTLGIPAPLAAEPAFVPQKNIAKGYALRLVIGAFCGLLAGYVLLIVQRLTMEGFANEEEFICFFGAAPLACVPEVKKRRKKRRFR